MNDNEVFYIYVWHSDPPHSTWKFIPDTPEERQKAVQDGYTAGSTMSFAYEPEKGKPEPLRRGPLVLDFDSKISPVVAIDMAKEFITRLEERFGVAPESLHYWMSGGKGCHIEIPAAIYGGEDGHPELHWIQKELLMVLGKYDFHNPKICEVLDFSLYCQGKGKLLRWPNIKRENDRYKVPVSAEEFFTLDYPALERLTFAPRIDFDPGTKKPVQSPRLAQLYDNILGWRRRFSNPSNSVSGLESLLNCAFMTHCYENQRDLPEPFWFVMVSILSTFGDPGRDTIHLFSQDYPGYSFEETEKKIERQKPGQRPIGCAYIKELGFDCGKTCGVRSPADLWRYKKSGEARQAMSFFHKEDGLYRQNEKGEGEAVKVCSPLKVLGKIRNPDGSGWARLVEITTTDGLKKEVCVYMRDMKGHGDALIMTLLDNGLEICQTSPKAEQYLKEYLMNGAPQDLPLLCVQQVGWLKESYVLPDAVFGSQLKEKVHFLAEGMDNLHQVAGTLEEWQEQVGGYCRGNSLLELLASYALTGPLLKLVGLESGGLHLFGESSIGKTTQLTVAGSVWGGGARSGFNRQWRTTSNALESVATQHNDGLLNLDEISQATPETVNHVAYMLANGQGKERMRADARPRKSYSWQLNFLSTGEQTINDKIQELGKQTTLAGQEVRVIDLPIDEGNTLQNLHGLPDSGKFMENLGANARKFYGRPIRAFLTELCKNLEENTLRASKDMAAFVADFCPAEASGQVKRVARKFGLIASAGELGIAFGVLPFEPGTSRKAAAAWFNIWLERRNGLGSLEMIRAIERIKNRLAKDVESSRFIDLDSPPSYPPSQVDGFTWMEGSEKYVMLLTQSFNDLAKGINPRSLIAELERLGYLARTKNGRLMETISVRGSSKRGVVFIPSAWEGAAAPDKVKEKPREARITEEDLFD